MKLAIMIISDGDIGYDSRQEKTYILPFLTGICFHEKADARFSDYDGRRKNALLPTQ